ncbi:MAG TPA: glycosyltransferase family 2 protein [Actinomycetota bacterium]
MTLSVVILATNEELMLPGALASAAFADEVLVVDGGSTDATATLAAAGGACVVSRPLDDFSSQRNFAMEQAMSDWVLFLDADERVTPGLAREVQALLAAGPPHDAYAIPRASMAFGRWLEWHPGGGPDAPVRLVRAGAARWVGEVHEALHGAASTGALTERLVHLTHRTVSEVVGKIDRYSEYEAAEMARRGAPAPAARDLLRSFRVALRSLLRSGLKREGIEGAVEALLLAFNRTLVMAKVWERANAERIAAAYARAEQDLRASD